MPMDATPTRPRLQPRQALRPSSMAVRELETVTVTPPLDLSASTECGEQTCRICLCPGDETDPLLPLSCACKGSLASIHAACAQRWFVAERDSGRCDVCGGVAWPAAGDVTPGPARRAALVREARTVDAEAMEAARTKRFAAGLMAAAMANALAAGILTCTRLSGVRVWYYLWLAGWPAAFGLCAITIPWTRLAPSSPYRLLPGALHAIAALTVFSTVAFVCVDVGFTLDWGNLALTGEGGSEG